MFGWGARTTFQFGQHEKAVHVSVRIASKTSNGIVGELGGQHWGRKMTGFASPVAIALFYTYETTPRFGSFVSSEIILYLLFLNGSLPATIAPKGGSARFSLVWPLIFSRPALKNQCSGDFGRNSTFTYCSGSNVV
jgi:hypothetical protein